MAKRVMMDQETEALRQEKLQEPSPCYDGQWTVHDPHTYEVHVQAWLGGGTAMVKCPGVTPETTMQARYPSSPLRSTRSPEHAEPYPPTPTRG